MLRPVSKKQSAKLSVYSRLRKEFLSENDVCQARLTGCTYRATDIHHTAGRGPSLNRVETWMGVCRNCHDIIHRMPKDLAYARGFKRK